METDNNVRDYNSGFENGYRQGFEQGYRKGGEHGPTSGGARENQHSGPDYRERRSGGKGDFADPYDLGTRNDGAYSAYGARYGEATRDGEEILTEGFMRNDPFASGPEGKSRGVAALLAIFLGSFGVQYFYLGKISAGVLSLVVSLVLTCTIFLAWVPGLVWFVQGILMFCMSNADFRRKYVTTRLSWPIF